MKASAQSERFHKLIDDVLERGFPTRVHFAMERGPLPGLGGAGLIDGPRLSLALSDTPARYVIKRRGAAAEIEVRQGEAIFAGPRCVMMSHPEARYLSLGLVFQRDLTRFLLAQKKPRRGQAFSHRFLSTHHSHTPIDAEGRGFLASLGRCGEEPTADGRYARRLLELVLLKAQGLLGRNAATEQPGGKARFTWQAACAFLREHLQEPVGREAVAQFLQLHPNHVSRLFTQHAGVGFHGYLLRLRMEEARRLLENPALNVAEVGRAVGFADAGYFVRCYRKIHGAPPGRSRRGGGG